MMLLPTFTYAVNKGKIKLFFKKKQTNKVLISLYQFTIPVHGMEVTIFLIGKQKARRRPVNNNNVQWYRSFSNPIVFDSFDYTHVVFAYYGGCFKLYLQVPMCFFYVSMSNKKLNSMYLEYNACFSSSCENEKNNCVYLVSLWV